MPLYEYRCLGCGEVTEVIQKYSDPPRSTCESCGGTLEQLLGAPAIQFKGSGWYITDYARKNGDKSSGNATSDAGGEKAAKTGESKTGESKAKAGADPGGSSK